jgi:hypothetical protein
MKRITRALTVGAIAALAVFPAIAQPVDPPGSIVDGKSIADWTEGWWTRYWQAPSNSIDPVTGNIPASINNDGPVFYAPTTSGDPGLGHVTINFSVPAGRPILIPLLPFDDLESAVIDGNAPLADRQAAADAVVAGWLTSVDPNSLFASIDGVSVANPASYLEQTGYFDAGPAQAGSIAVAGGETVGDELSPNKAAGYWIMVENLSGGEHTIDFGGSSGQFTPAENCCTDFPIGPFAVDVTANIDVIPEPDEALLLFSWTFGTFLYHFRRRRPRSGRSA